MKDRLENFGKMQLLAKKIVHGYMAGLHASPFNGFSVEFNEHRQYNEGESVKNVDWKLYAKTDKLYTKLYEEETNLRCHIMIDQSGSMLYPERDENNYSKLEYAMYAAASFTELLRKQRDAFEVNLFGEELNYCSGLGNTEKHQQQIFEVLEKELTKIDYAKVGESTKFARSLRTLGDYRSKKRLFVIFSDFLFIDKDLEQWKDVLQELLYNGHEVLLFNIFHPSEYKLELENKFYKLVDLESGESMKIHANELNESDVLSLNPLKDSLKTEAGLRKMEWVDCDVSQPIENMLRAFFNKRRKKR